MLAPHAVDIRSWNLCYYYLTMFHICQTTFLSSRSFVKSSCALVSGNTNKSLWPKEGRSDRQTDRPSEWIRARSLNSYFAFLQNSHKNGEVQEAVEQDTGRRAFWPCVPTPLPYIKNKYFPTLEKKRYNKCFLTIEVFMCNMMLGMWHSNICIGI